MAPPAGLEPATTCINKLVSQASQVEKNAFGLNDRILQAKPHSSRQFRLRRSCLSRMLGADASTKKKANRKARGVCLGLSVGSPCWARTSDNLINSQVLYRLS